MFGRGQSRVSEVTEVDINPKDFGNGVFLFKYDPFSGAENFGDDLARFKEEHPELEVTAIASVASGPHGVATTRTNVFWVNCERRVK